MTRSTEGADDPIRTPSARVPVRSCVCVLSHGRLFTTLWTVARQASLLLPLLLLLLLLPLLLLLLLLLSRFSRVRPCVTPYTAAHQAPPSPGFSRQEYWSGVPLPSPPGFSRLCQSPIPIRPTHH